MLLRQHIICQHLPVQHILPARANIIVTCFSAEHTSTASASTLEYCSGKHTSTASANILNVLPSAVKCCTAQVIVKLQMPCLKAPCLNGPASSALPQVLYQLTAPFLLKCVVLCFVIVTDTMVLVSEDLVVAALHSKARLCLSTLCS